MKGVFMAGAGGLHVLSVAFFNQARFAHPLYPWGPDLHTDGVRCHTTRCPREGMPFRSVVYLTGMGR